jgi:protocatechuate 3,4-dioxygenase beta subunit
MLEHREVPLDHPFEGVVVPQAFVPTPQHTTGPFFPPEHIGAGDNDLTNGGQALGVIVELTGQVLDLLHEPAVNVILEIWQADATGFFDDPSQRCRRGAHRSFRGWGRTCTDEQGRYRFLTVKPGSYPVPGHPRWVRPPHINLRIIGSGIMRPLVTQIFFPGEPLNAVDRQLLAVADPEARERLIAKPVGGERADADTGAGRLRYSLRFDVVLRGRGETPFFVD